MTHFDSSVSCARTSVTFNFELLVPVTVTFTSTQNIYLCICSIFGMKIIYFFMTSIVFLWHRIFKMIWFIQSFICPKVSLSNHVLSKSLFHFCPTFEQTTIWQTHFWTHEWFGQINVIFKISIKTIIFIKNPKFSINNRTFVQI